MLGAVAATATAMTVGMASPGMTPAANAVTFNVFGTTTGPILWAADLVGLDSISDTPIPGTTLNADLAYVPSDPVKYYAALNIPVVGPTSPQWIHLVSRF